MSDYGNIINYSFEFIVCEFNILNLVYHSSNISSGVHDLKYLTLSEYR